MSTSLAIACGPDAPPLAEVTLGQLLAEIAAEVPERLALIEALPGAPQARSWTYAALQAEALRTAQALLAHFVPGERVVIWAPNVPEWILCEFGAACAGLVLVTANPALQAREIRYVLEQSDAAGILVWPDFRGNPMLEIAESVRADCPQLRHVIRLDRWKDFLAAGDASPCELPPVRPGDAVMIQYTSGTTGFPKGALLHHRGLVNNGIQIGQRMGIRPGGTTLTIMPLFHTGGCGCAVLGAVATRSTQVLVRAFEPGLVLELLERHRIEACVGVPTMLLALLEHPARAERDLSALRAICSGGATVPAPLVERFERELDARFTIVFGQTECSPVACMTRPDDTLEDKAGTLGTPLPHIEVKIVDPHSGATLPHGAVGEFCTLGYHVMLGYFGMPEATRAAIDAEGWLHTGDLCEMDARGYCTVQGRIKDMIIRGGENIYPREVEELLFRHPAVAEVAVVGLPDERFGEIVAAFVRDAEGVEPASDAQLHAWCRAQLSPQKTPAVWVRVSAFPLTGSGKIQKFALRDGWLAAQEQGPGAAT